MKNNFILKGLMNSLKLLGQIFSRVIVIYFLIAVLSVYFFNFSNILDRNKAEELNEIMPTFGYLQDYNESQGPFNQAQLESYIKYYEKVDEYLPKQADVYSLLGFCYYYKKDFNKAIVYYKKAIEVNPHVFWFHYNLGVIYYKMGNYPNAIASLQAAIDRKPEHALMFVAYSRSFRRIVHGVKNFKSALEERLQESYAKCLALLVLSHYQTGHFDQAYNVAIYALQLTSQNKDFFYYYAGISAFKMKEYSKSAYFFKELLKNDPNNRDALLHLALSFKNLGADQVAEIAMKKALMTPDGKQKPILSDKDISLKIF